MPWAMVNSIYETRVVAGNVAHKICQRLVARRHGHMDVISHPAIRVNSVAVSVETLFKDSLPLVSVSGGKENILPAIAAQNDVIETTRKVDSRFTRHQRGSGQTQ
jgi:hypothetical protein